VEVDGQPGLADLLEQAIEVRQPGLRLEEQRVAGFAEHSQHAPEFHQGVPASPLDHLENVARLLMLRAEHLPFGPSLNHHHAHRVRDHVVELAGDPRSLEGDGQPCPLIALPLEL